MTLAKNEHGEVRSVSGIILYAKRIGVDTLNVREYISNTRVSACFIKINL